jgi:hypothetical protein
VWLGRGAHRRDAELLTAAAPAPQAPEVDQSLGSLQRGDQAADPRRPHLPDAESCLRLIRALAVETHENWLEAHRYLNMDDLREHKKEVLRMAA